MIERISSLIAQVRKQQPLVHHITNYVTVNDCANITLAIGASPVMADDIGEAADIAAISSALVLNMGTLNSRTIQSMIAAGKSANAHGIPVVFDPVGVGASKLRNDTAAQLCAEVDIAVIRGNISEIRFLAGLESHTKGVDASENDILQENSEHVAADLANKRGCIVAITGAEDVISDGERCIFIRNGHPMLSRLTGTGCMCSSLIGALCGAAPLALLDATAAALLAMGIAGEIAFEKAGHLGNGSFRMALHDAVSSMDERILMQKAKLHEA